MKGPTIIATAVILAAIVLFVGRRNLLRATATAGTVSVERVTHDAEMSWSSRSVTGRATGVSTCFETIRPHFPQPGDPFLSDADRSAGSSTSAVPRSATRLPARGATDA